MLKNKLYLYGEYDEDFNIAAHLQLGKHMLEKAKSFGDRIAVINAANDERMTYNELAQQSVDIALSLAHIGVKKGDVVAICSCSRMEYIPIAIGTLLIGAVLANVYSTCTGLLLLHRLKLAQAKILFCTSSKYQENKEIIKRDTDIEKTIVFDEPVEGAIHFKDFFSQHASVEDFEATPVNGYEDVAIILFSSGTTGMSKGVKLTHYNILCTAQHPSHRVSEGTRVLNCLNWSGAFGLYTTIAFIQFSATLVLSVDLDGAQLLDVMQRYKVHIAPLVTTTIAAINSVEDISKYDISSLKLIYVSGTICNESILDTFRKRKPSVGLVTQCYGMTEMGNITSTICAKFGHRSGSVGAVRNLFVLKIVDVETREPLGPHQRGEICCKSPTLLQGYIGEAVDYLDDEGFLKTGDLGYYDEDQYVYIVDRIKDIINYNCVAMSPSELEAVLQQHPAVHEAGVVGAPQGEVQELPTAFVVLKPGVQITEQELIDFCNKNVAQNIMQLAGGVRFINELPRGAGLKLDRKKLRAML